MQGLNNQKLKTKIEKLFSLDFNQNQDTTKKIKIFESETSEHQKTLSLYLIQQKPNVENILSSTHIFCQGSRLEKLIVLMKRNGYYLNSVSTDSFNHEINLKSELHIMFVKGDRS